MFRRLLPLRLGARGGGQGSPANTPAVERKRERVILETSRYRIAGEVMLPPEGYKSRLSDHINEPRREFLIVLDATMTPLEDPENRFRSRVVMIHRAKIDVIFPEDELTDVGDAY